jgi:uncharacterized membrane protein
MRPSFDAIKTEALQILDKRWRQAVIAFAMIALIQLLLGSTGYLSLVNILVKGAFGLGLSYYFLRLSRQQEPLEASDVFSGFKRYGDALLAGVLMVAIVVFTVLIVGGLLIILPSIYAYSIASHFPSIDNFDEFLARNLFKVSIFSLLILGIAFLLILPGIIVSLAISQTYNIMNDNPEMSPIDAMRKSHELMKGHRTDYFLFNLSFIGWALLCILTLGLGFLILGPYISTSNALYYKYLVGVPNTTSNNEAPQPDSDFQKSFDDLTAPYRNQE